ncbi:hypothetical protein [Vibrio sp. V39_P1S14PM300]|uniref:hypothetical protein n=1 Tax=Vibrio sp. V39_P1S14PM300 TaxID=1938690 RepID=UPI00137259F4|nr:hypothetical protein [Vibrio sp. V39_P1S14PM300]NAX21835.1 hypothetical protein [Vibrio sp. V39_P1S14PM300]
MKTYLSTERWECINQHAVTRTALCKKSRRRVQKSLLEKVVIWAQQQQVSP